MDQYNEKFISAETKAKVEQLKADIIAGKSTCRITTRESKL